MAEEKEGDTTATQCRALWSYKRPGPSPMAAKVQCEETESTTAQASVTVMLANNSGG